VRATLRVNGSAGEENPCGRREHLVVQLFQEASPTQILLSDSEHARIYAGTISHEPPGGLDFEAIESAVRSPVWPA